MWRMLRGRRGCAVVHSLSRAWLLVTLWTAAHQASLCFTISQNLFKLMSIESMMLSKHVILCHTLLFLLSIFPSIRDFSSESALHIRQPRYWSYSFNISPFKEFSGLISFQSTGLGRVIFSTTIWRRFFGAQLPYDPTLTSIHDYWKNHSFDYTDLFWQSDVSAF